MADLDRVYNDYPIASSPTMTRVFDLDAASNGNFDAPVCGRLRVVDLVERPNFTTLSYVWGQDPPNKPITITGSGVAVCVTKSCVSALKHLRKLYGPVTIWVDAICINQDSIADKKQQIPLMGQIYSSAQVGYIWLGEGSKKSDDAMEFLASSWVTRTSSPKLLALSFIIRRLTFRTAPQFDALQHLFQKEWITRLWTLQEIMLAKESIVVCGTRQMSWKKFATTIAKLGVLRTSPPFLVFPPELESWTQLQSFWTLEQETYQYNLKTHADLCAEASRLYALVMRAVSAVLTAFFLMCWPIAIILAYKKHSAKEVYLFILLFYAAILPLLLAMGAGYFHERNTSRHSSRIAELSRSTAATWHIAERKCKLPQDKYFGVLGILNSSQNANQVLSSGSDVATAHRALTLELINWSRSFEALLIVSENKYQDSPSWVIDWSAAQHLWLRTRYAPKAKRLPKSWWYIRRPRFIENCFRGATASEEGTTTQFLPQSGDTLRLKCLTLAYVTEAFEIEKLFTRRERKKLKIPKASKKQISQSKNMFQRATAGIPTEKLIAMILDLYYVSRTDIGHELNVVRTQCKWWVSLYATNIEELGYAHRLWLWCCKLWKVEAWTAHCSLTKLADVGKLVRCTGENTGYDGVGVAPYDVEEGDMVALVEGLSMPIVLRKATLGAGRHNNDSDADRGNLYTLVGPAMLGAVMNGEQWTEENRQKLVDVRVV